MFDVFITPIDCSPPGSSVHGIFPGKNTGVGGQCPLRGDLPEPGTEPSSLMSPALEGTFFTTSTTWEAHIYIYIYINTQMVKICLQCGRPGFDPWFGKTPWRREWLPIAVLLPGEFHVQRRGQATVHGVAKSWTLLSE